jgi:hypothetical protein
MNSSGISDNESIESEGRRFTLHGVPMTERDEQTRRLLGPWSCICVAIVVALVYPTFCSWWYRRDSFELLVYLIGAIAGAGALLGSAGLAQSPPQASAAVGLFMNLIAIITWVGLFVKTYTG